MNMNEFLKVKEMTYIEYCDYLQKKYGVGKADYMTRSFNKNPKCSRTSEGLIAHHKAEDRMIMLSTKAFAELCPYEWQLKENIVYCDYLEHLFLHVLICKYPSNKKMPIADVGIGGVVNFIVPELNDMYSGWVTNQRWRSNCHRLVENDRDVYLAILRIFIEYIKKERNFNENLLHTSYNEEFGGWSRKQNMGLYSEIDKLWNETKDEHMVIKGYEFCKCTERGSIASGYEDDFGYWDVCMKCGKRIEDGYHQYNHYDGEDHEVFWGPSGEIVE